MKWKHLKTQKNLTIDGFCKTKAFMLIIFCGDKNISKLTIKHLPRFWSFRTNQISMPIAFLKPEFKRPTNMELRVRWLLVCVMILIMNYSMLTQLRELFTYFRCRECTLEFCFCFSAGCWVG